MRSIETEYIRSKPSLRVGALARPRVHKWHRQFRIRRTHPERSPTKPIPSSRSSSDRATAPMLPRTFAPRHPTDPLRPSSRCVGVSACDASYGVRSCINLFFFCSSSVCVCVCPKVSMSTAKKFRVARTRIGRRRRPTKPRENTHTRGVGRQKRFLPLLFFFSSWRMQLARYEVVGQTFDAPRAVGDYLVHGPPIGSGPTSRNADPSLFSSSPSFVAGCWALRIPGLCGGARARQKKRDKAGCTRASRSRDRRPHWRRRASPSLPRSVVRTRAQAYCTDWEVMSAAAAAAAFSTLSGAFSTGGGGGDGRPQQAIVKASGDGRVAPRLFFFRV